MGSQIQKDDQPFEIDWLDPVNGPAALNELGAALLATYGPSLPQTANCLGTGQCIETPEAAGVDAYFFIPQLGFSMSPSSTSAAQPTPSIMENFQLYAASAPVTDGGTPNGP